MIEKCPYCEKLLDVTDITVTGRYICPHCSKTFVFDKETSILSKTKDDWKVLGGDGKEYGPIDLPTLRQWIEENRVAEDEFVFGPSYNDWLLAKEAPQLNDLFEEENLPDKWKSLNEKQDSLDCQERLQGRISIWEKLKGLGWGILGIAIPLILALFTVLFIYGGVQLSAKLYPILKVIFTVVFGIVLFVLIPLSIFRKTRGVSGIGILISSYIFGLTLWVWSFLLTYSLWGWLGLLIGLFVLGIGVMPIAILATLFKGMWSTFGQLISLVILTFGSRLFGIYLTENYERTRYDIRDNSITDEDSEQESNRRLSIGVYILSILFIVLGGLWVIGFLIYPSREALSFFIYGMPYLVSGIGMLKRKYWALKVSQIFLILSALPCIILIPVVLIGKTNLFITLLILIFAFVFFGLPIWFLFKKSTVDQFKRREKIFQLTKNK